VNTASKTASAIFDVILVILNVGFGLVNNDMDFSSRLVPCKQAVSSTSVFALALWNSAPTRGPFPESGQRVHELDTRSNISGRCVEVLMDRGFLEVGMRIANKPAMRKIQNSSKHGFVSPAAFVFIAKAKSPAIILLEGAWLLA
jgi:hypothetical protein